MSKRKDDEVDRLEQKIRELKSENRSLQKRLKKLNKGYYKLRDQDKIEEDDIPIEVKRCWDCNGEGEYRLIEIHRRRWRQCQNCGKKGKVTVL